MDINSDIALPTEWFGSLARPSAFVLWDLGLDDQEMAYDWRHGEVSTSTLLEALGPKFPRFAEKIIGETYSAAEREGILQAAERVAEDEGIQGVEEQWPVAVIARDGGFELTTYPVLILLARRMQLSTVPIYLARRDSRGPATWDREHVLN